MQDNILKIQDNKWWAKKNMAKSLRGVILPKLVISEKWKHEWILDLALMAWFNVFVVSI